MFTLFCGASKKKKQLGFGFGFRTAALLKTGLSPSRLSAALCYAAEGVCSAFQIEGETEQAFLTWPRYTPLQGTGKYLPTTLTFYSCRKGVIENSITAQTGQGTTRRVCSFNSHLPSRPRCRRSAGWRRACLTKHVPGGAAN